MAKATAAERARINRLVSENAGLAIAACEPYYGRGVDADDLAQAAFLGLVKAANLWRDDDPSGAKFATYATWKIRHELQQAQCGRTTIRMPSHAAKRREDWPVVGRLERPEAIGDPRSDTGRADRADEIEAAMARLPVPERKAIVLRYGLGDKGPMTTSEVGRRLGVTQQAASLRVIRGLQLLREELEPNRPDGPDLRLALA